MKTIASAVALALLSATVVSAADINPRYTLAEPTLVGEVVQRPAADVVIAGDFVNSDTVSVTVVERSATAPVTTAR